jgi:large conductance mechanosensitive channel
MKLSVKEMLGEFKNFAFKGNMIDLAVGVVIGGAFGTVIKSLVENVVMPIVGLVPGLKNGYVNWHIGPILVGRVLADLLNFTLVALAVFLVIVKVLGAIMKAASRKPITPDEPTTKECPKCLSLIPIRATKCAHCTADLPGGAIEGELMTPVGEGT